MTDAAPRDLDWSIARLGPDDVAAYRAIRHEALVHHPEAFLSAAEDFIARSDGHLAETLSQCAIFAAILPDRSLGGIVGFAHDTAAKQRHRGWMIQFYVRPAHRGAGMARSLSEQLIAYAQNHVLQLHLGVWTQNAPAIALYEKLGFKIYATEPRYLLVNGRYHDEYLMVRFLDAPT